MVYPIDGYNPSRGIVSDGVFGPVPACFQRLQLPNKCGTWKHKVNWILKVLIQTTCIRWQLITDSATDLTAVGSLCVRFFRKKWYQAKIKNIVSLLIFPVTHTYTWTLTSIAKCNAV